MKTENVFDIAIKHIEDLRRSHEHNARVFDAMDRRINNLLNEKAALETMCLELNLALREALYLGVLPDSINKKLSEALKKSEELTVF